MDYKHIMVGKYVDLMATIKDYSGSELGLHCELIAIVYDMTEDEVLDLPLSKFEEYEREISFLFTKPKFKSRIPNKIVLNGRKYEIVKDAKQLTAAQYIDYSTYCQLPDKDFRIAEILSVFLVPEGEKYGHYDIAPVIEEIKNYLDVQTALDICFFFRKKSLKSIERTVFFLQAWTKMMQRKARKNPKMKEKLTEIQENLKKMEVILLDANERISTM